MKCPACNSELIVNEQNETLTCPNCGIVIQYSNFDVNSKKQVYTDGTNSAPQNAVNVNAQTVAQNAQNSAVQKSQVDEIAELKERIAKLEERLTNPKLEKFKTKMAPVTDFFKKWGLKVILPAAIVFIAFVTLLSCFAGLRGVYVSVDEPNTFYSFTAGKYVSYAESEFGGEPSAEKGSWSIKGNKLTLKIKDEDLGKMSDDLDFKKLKGYDLIEIEGTKFKRVSLINYRDTLKKATVTFDSQGGSAISPMKFKIGGKISAKTFANLKPKKIGCEFVGWYNAPKGTEGVEGISQDDRIWENATYYAHWSGLDPLYEYSELEENFTGYTLKKYYGKETEIVIPNGVTEIASGAFSDCKDLKLVEIHDDIRYISDKAFTNCENVTIKASARVLYKIPMSNVKSLFISSGEISNMAFKDVTTLERVTIGDDVTSIGSRAFSGCTNLSEVTLSNSLTTIGNEAFENCIGLTSVLIPRSVTEIGDYAFYGCKNLLIYAVASSKPSGWSDTWNSDREVIWDFVG